MSGPEESPKPASPGLEGGWWPEWATPKRAMEFAANIYKVERAITRLAKENEALKSDVAELKANQLALAKQNELLVRFIETSMNDRIDIRAENAVLRMVAQMKLPPIAPRD